MTNLLICTEHHNTLEIIHLPHTHNLLAALKLLKLGSNTITQNFVGTSTLMYILGEALHIVFSDEYLYGCKTSKYHTTTSICLIYSVMDECQM